MMQRTLYIVIQLVIFFSIREAHSWADHHLITRQILQEEIPNTLVVQYEDISTLLAKLNFKDQIEFNSTIQIHKNYVFQNKLNETWDQVYSVIDILSTYSDEPDWGMDQELFSEDQYPQLWKQEYQMMGGTSGLSSQSFRHMYWREMYWKHPVQSLKLPLNKISEPMGEAHLRAALFIQLAKKAFKVSSHYWGWRFTAFSLHYLEDVAQPFHTAQVPSKMLINMVLAGCMTELNCNDFITRMTNIISYYHFAYEDTVGLIFNNREAFKIKPDFVAALNKNTNRKYINMSPKDIVVQIAQMANGSSAEAGLSSIYFFPLYSGSYLTLSAESFMDEKWWQKTSKALQKKSPTREVFLKSVESQFYELGDAVRCWIENLQKTEIE